MGRPKGSKNKPKVPPVATLATAVAAPPKVKKEPTIVVVPKTHVVTQFVDYVIERMDGIEMDCQKRQAKKAERPLKYWLAKSVLDFFRIQDPTFDLASLLKETK